MRLPAKILLIVLTSLSVSVAACAQTYIRVRNQQDFDNLQENLIRRINTGRVNIHVLLSEGRYIARENHIFLNNINKPNTSIRIIGKNAVLVPEGDEYKDGDSYMGVFSPNHSWMYGENDINIWSNIRFADGLIEVLDDGDKLCRLKSKESLPYNTDVTNAYILIPHWFRSSVYKISRIEGRYIYFTASDLAAGYKKGYNVNDDYNYGRQNIRYKLCNVDDGYIKVANGRCYLPEGVDSVREGKSLNYIRVQNSQLKSLEISGIAFQGNSFSDSKAALDFQNVSSEAITIHDCRFLGMRSTAISLTSTGNVTVMNNRFQDCYYHAIVSENGSSNTIVKGNHFCSMGKRITNSACVRCNGPDYLIASNTFINYGYSGIIVGVWYKLKNINPSRGIIEKNSLVYTEDYIANIANYGSMDAGSIYLCTKNDGVIVRYNHIRNFTGLRFNNGIYCDDGAYGFRIIGNVITGIDNGRGIDSRRVSSVEIGKTPESGIQRANVDIVIKDNVVDAGIRFIGNESANNNCIKGRNYFLVESGKPAPRSTYKNVSIVSDDVTIGFFGYSEDSLIVCLHGYESLQKTAGWAEVKKYFSKKN